MKCELCGSVFERKNGRQKYCTDKCRIKAKAVRVNKPSITKRCKICDKEFTVQGKSSNSVFCSKQCKNKRNYVKKSCVSCQITFLADKRTKCCSRECTIKFHSIKSKKECPICKKQFEVSPSRQRLKYCSESCYRESRRTGPKSNCDCEVCGSFFYKAPCLQKKHNFNYCSRECMAIHYADSGRFSGKNSPTYIGSYERHKKYYGENWLKQRRLARKRDNYMCQSCGITEDRYKQQLSVHHKIPFIAFKTYLEANDLNNLICLCELCHRKEHSGENHHTKFREKYDLWS